MANGFRLIDLSVPIEHEAVSEPWPARIRPITHEGEGLETFKQAFGVSERDLVYSDGLGGAWEELSAITHTATHMDAPWHYHPTSEGRPAKTIEQIPLEWCFADGVRLDFRHKAEGEFITVEDLQAELRRIDYQLKPLDIVLLWTGADERIQSADYFQQPGLGWESTVWLCDQGVKIIGIDAYTLDRSFAAMRQDFERTGDGHFIWPAHFAGIIREYCQIEKLANLGALPGPTGYKVMCFPIKVAGASAGWVRAVALVEE